MQIRLHRVRGEPGRKHRVRRSEASQAKAEGFPHTHDPTRRINLAKQNSWRRDENREGRQESKERTSGVEWALKKVTRPKVRKG